MRSRHPAVEADREGEGLRGFLKSARSHQRVAEVQLGRRNIRLEINCFLQHVDGSGEPPRSDQPFALAGEPVRGLHSRGLYSRR